MRASARGFTLAEATVVLALLILVAAVALPLLASSSSFTRLRADAFDIAGEITLAKFRAANELTAYRIRFDLTNNSYQLERHMGGGNFQPEGPVRRLRSSTIYATTGDLTSYKSVPTNGEQGSVCKQSAVIAFNTRGVPVDSSGLPIMPNNAIYLRNDRMDSFAVTVSLAGLVEIWRYLPDGSWVPPQ